TGLAHVNSGKIKPLAVFTKTRSQQMPSVPTLDETVMPGFELLPWCGLSGPANLPPHIVDTLARVLEDRLNKPEVQETYLRAGVGPFWAGPEEFKRYVTEQQA